MNRHRLARSMGFRSYQELLDTAALAKEYKEALRKEKDGHAGFVRAGEEATKARVALARLREDIALEYEELSGLYRDRASAAERERGACSVLEGYYADVASAVRAGTMPSAVRTREATRAITTLHVIKGAKENGQANTRSGPFED